MNRRSICHVLVGATLLGASGTSAHAAREQQVVLVAYRTTTGAASLDLQVDAPPGEKPSVVALIVATVDRGRIGSVDLGTVVLSGEADQAQARVNGSRTVLCEQGVCSADTSTMTAGGAVRITNVAGDDRWNLLVVVARGRTAVYRATAKGWAVKRVSLTHRVVAGPDVSDAGVYALGSGAERFTEASALGGPSGSIAVSEPPCSESASGVVSRGVGTLTLDGGVERDTFTCPVDRGSLAAWATRRTTWHTHGGVVGDTTMAGARLFVVDLPRRLPVPNTWPWR